MVVGADRQVAVDEDGCDGAFVAPDTRVPRSEVGSLGADLERDRGWTRPTPINSRNVEQI